MRPHFTILLMASPSKGRIGRRIETASVRALLGAQLFALFDVLVPGRRFEAVLDLDHVDAARDRADDLAEVAAHALALVDDRNARVRAGGRLLRVALGVEPGEDRRVLRVDALVRAVLAGGDAEV